MRRRSVTIREILQNQKYQAIFGTKKPGKYGRRVKNLRQKHVEKLGENTLR